MEIPKVTGNNQDLVIAVRSGALENIQTLIVNTESDINVSAITSVKWPSLQRLILSSCSAYTSDRCVAILQAIREAKEKEMLPNLDEVFITLGIIHIDPSMPADWENYFFVMWHVQLALFLLSGGSDLSQEIKNSLYLFRSTTNLSNNLDIDEYAESILNRLHEKIKLEDDESLQLCRIKYEFGKLGIRIHIFAPKSNFRLGDID